MPDQRRGPVAASAGGPLPQLCGFRPTRWGSIPLTAPQAAPAGRGGSRRADRHSFPEPAQGPGQFQTVQGGPARLPRTRNCCVAEAPPRIVL